MEQNKQTHLETQKYEPENVQTIEYTHTHMMATTCIVTYSIDYKLILQKDEKDMANHLQALKLSTVVCSNGCIVRISGRLKIEFN